MPEYNHKNLKLHISANTDIPYDAEQAIENCIASILQDYEISYNYVNIDNSHADDCDCYICKQIPRVKKYLEKRVGITLLLLVRCLF